MKVGIGSDHKGYLLKREILEYYQTKSLEVKDYGTDSEKTSDYPDIAKKVGEAIKSGKIDYGVLICGTGIGVCIAANKIKGIRCALVRDSQEAYLARNHNNANVMAISKSVNLKNATDLINIFIKSPFSSDDRHRRRVEKINQIENS